MLEKSHNISFTYNCLNINILLKYICFKYMLFYVKADKLNNKSYENIFKLVLK